MVLWDPRDRSDQSPDPWSQNVPVVVTTGVLDRVINKSDLISRDSYPPRPQQTEKKGTNRMTTDFIMDRT